MQSEVRVVLENFNICNVNLLVRIKQDNEVYSETLTIIDGLKHLIEKVNNKLYLALKIFPSIFNQEILKFLTTDF